MTCFCCFIMYFFSSFFLGIDLKVFLEIKDLKKPTCNVKLHTKLFFKHKVEFSNVFALKCAFSEVILI